MFPGADPEAKHCLLRWGGVGLPQETAGREWGLQVGAGSVKLEQLEAWEAMAPPAQLVGVGAGV